jgi:hypothetical protein
MIPPWRLLQEEIGQAISKNPVQPVNLNRYRHTHIVKGLHGLVFGDGYSESTAKRFRVTFNDGTETTGFPMHCLTLPDPLDKMAYPLRVGLNSGRHPELDCMVEFYLFRNAQVNEWETAAEQEQEAFSYALDFLMDPFWVKGGVIECYHTGLEPLITGFYRAVVASARQRIRKGLPRLQVVPRIFAPSEVDLSGYVARRNKNPKKSSGELESLKKSIQPMTKELSDFLKVTSFRSQTVLKWKPERPMWTSEKDYLHFRYPSLNGLIETLFQRTQYQTLPHWG